MESPITLKTSASPTSTAYEPNQIEEKWYGYWESQGFFHAGVDAERRPHVIMMPPPNVTGRLHMGHALQDTVQDALTRIRRMQGREALWMPGLDHAGIATQNVVEGTVRSEGTSRRELGREAFVARLWEWVREYGDIILRQKRKLGDSCDWSRQRFTFDEDYVGAVERVFVQLYEHGLIYRGQYLVNWDPENQTALSDEEVENVERDGNLWYVHYPLADGDGGLTIATTRPETMLGDTAVAVHPKDERYRHLIGKTILLPLLERPIPIVADEYVKQDFGAGALKITPAHDRNDFDIGQRHGLPAVNVMNPDGTIAEAGGPYAGMDRFDARERIVSDLAERGLLERVEPYRHAIPISSRSKTIVEPLISRQWFVRMRPLAERAMEAVRSGEITFYPERWANEYFRWLENIRDWCISRQLWWGHRIPVWYYTDAEGEVDESRSFVVSLAEPEPGMVQDEDVLDTWFSSWLWPFATLGWPDENEKTKRDLQYFYPTDVLVSGYDILFFWIARMIMAGLHFTGQVPYRDVFITGMIKDKQGRWMSKSLGNGIDPLEMIDQYGADAVRYSLTILCAQGQDIKLDPLKFEMGRNFANKIWNAFNVFGQFMDEGIDYRRTRSFAELELAERWILHRLNETIATVDESVDRYRLNEALAAVYDLFWHDYCDWYLELIKPPRGQRMERDVIALAVEVYERVVQLLHPFMPFITEELWHRLRPRSDRDACIVSTWPERNLAETDATSAAHFRLIQDMISGIRNVRSEYTVSPATQVSAVIKVAPEDAELVDHLFRHADYFAKLARVGELEVGTDRAKPRASASVVVGRQEVFVPLVGIIDLDTERARLRKAIEQAEGFLTGVERKLRNPQFVNRAPADVVHRERVKQQDASAEVRRLRANLADLE